ncbi:peptide deformylase [Desulfothermus okinawensis JCM 13304]
MGIRKIVCYPDPGLRVKTEEITTIDKEIKDLAEDMLDTMYENKGIGLAAPQIGVCKKIVTIDLSGSDKRENPMVLINPEIYEKEGDIEGEEGCLSFPGFRCNIKRAEKIKVRFLDLDGKEHDICAQNLLSVCIQHEIDHLHGKLIIDYAGRLKKAMYEKKLKKIAKRTQKK